MDHEADKQPSQCLVQVEGEEMITSGNDRRSGKEKEGRVLWADRDLQVEKKGVFGGHHSVTYL